MAEIFTEANAEESAEDEDGADPFDAAEGMIDEHLLRALRTQRDAYRQMNWRASVTTRTVRATPLSVVVAPAQRLDWYPHPSGLRPGGEKLRVRGAGGRGAGRPNPSKPTWMLRLSRVGAVVKGLISAATGQGGCFALLVDCHLEVEEDFTIIDQVTRTTIRRVWSAFS